MVSRKRGRQEMEVESPPSEERGLLDRIRNMWQFANLMQFLFIFGKAVKVDDGLGIEDLEAECLKPVHSEKLSEIGLGLLKFVSSHRGLTPDIFDEQLRRQYQSKLPNRNPLGDSKKFADLDVLTKIRVLWQLSQWTMIHSERIRERMSDEKDFDQTYWRVEPTGWDAEERTYFLLDDNRLYRRTDPPPPPPPAPKPKKNSKRAKALAKANKRRKISEENAEHVTTGDEAEGAAQEKTDEDDDGLGGMKWECVAITVTQYKEFMETIRRSRDENEKALYKHCLEEVLPIVEKAEEEQQRKLAKKQKELLNLEKLATAKRSSRIAGRLEKQREAEEAAEAERKRKADLIMAKKEQERLKKLEQDRESRIMTREQRLKEREMRRILHEQELANLSEDSKRLDHGEGRLSERHLKAEMEKRKKALEELSRETDWDFDCSGCGVHGQNLDDGTGIIACERCNVWQHLACLGLNKETAERKDFHFVCGLCKRREEDRQKSAKNPIKLDFRKLGSSMSPPADKTSKTNGEAPRQRKRRISDEEPSSSPRKKVKHEGVATPLTTADSGISNASRSNAVEGNGDVHSEANMVGSTSPSLPNGSVSPRMGAPGQESTNGVKPPSHNLQGNGLTNNTPSNTTESQSLSPTTANGIMSNSFEERRPYTPTANSNALSRQTTSPSQEHKDITRPGFPVATPPSAIFAPPPSSLGYSPTKRSSPPPSSLPPSSLGYSPTKHSSPPSAKMFQSPNGTLLAAPILPPSSAGISPTKRPGSRGEPGKGAVMSPLSGMSTIPPGPALTPTPPEVDLTPPTKKLTSSPGPAPESIQMNGHHMMG